MVKHFEELWEQSEELLFDNQEQFDHFLPFKFSEQDFECALFNTNKIEKREKIIGCLLMKISLCSKLYDINVFEAMKNQMDEFKAELYDSK